MKLTAEDYDHLSVMALRGDLVAEGCDELKRAASERMSRQVRDFVLDLSGLEFVDSQGLETLVWLQEKVAEDLGQIRLAAPQDNVKKILHMTRLAGRFDTHDEVEPAIKSLR